MMPKISRSILDQAVFRKMIGVDGCKFMKMKEKNSWKLIKIPFDVNSQKKDESIESLYADLPINYTPQFDLINYTSPFNFLDKIGST